MRAVRITLWGGVGVALAGFLWLSLWHDRGPSGGSSSQDVATSFRPTFNLTDHRSNAVTVQSYQGKWLLVFFGFTNCPDICPTTLAELARVMERLGPDAGLVKPLFVSIDPERDRVETMAEYVSVFHPTIVGLTGTEAQIAEAARSRQAVLAGPAVHELEAKSLLQKHRETYRTFWAWADNNKDIGLLGLKLETCFGWTIQVEAGEVKANTFLNWPMQAHGAEMIRIACILAVERGINLCAPIHDALLIEAPIDQIDTEVTRLKTCMSEASEAVLGNGKACRVDACIVRYPDRFMDEDGQAMWDQIMGLLAETEG